MPKHIDARVAESALRFIPVATRIPLKFGAEVTTHVTCARACVTMAGTGGRRADGWGETPLSAAWVWPSPLTYAERDGALREFARRVSKKVAGFDYAGHPMEIGRVFMDRELPALLDEFNRTERQGREPMPWLAALVAFSPFDIAIHDAFAILNGKFVYDTYTAEFMNRDLSWFYGPEHAEMFSGKYPDDYLLRPAPAELPAWHLVGGKDILAREGLTGSEPDDGYPVVLPDWIDRDGLQCLKVKLTGNDAAWDYARLIEVGGLALAGGCDWLSADFNCTVQEPAYVNGILDDLMREHPRLYGMILYVEQPFPYELPEHRIDVHSVSARKPLFMDESAHDWRLVALGRTLGWTGVALKTCKTQTGALLSACWAKAHGMTLMVQDLTNPMLAQIPHLLLAAHVGTIMGVETNAMQFYPAASAPEAKIHPGMYIRRNGRVRLDSVGRIGFGYRLAEIDRELPPPED
ncbi:MAG: hypothetical protein LBE84_05130 [Planctomycetota bacterium]|jgi:hypothetical protein|nr:hypothetical protein [Planctomycetota bacterium]